MELMDALNARFSYRGMYRQEPVPRDDLRKILEAGLAAPSGCNKQTTSLVAVDDPKTLRAFAELLENASFGSSPAGICVLTRRIIAYRDRTYFVQDYASAIENMLLAITALGYASCWVEGHITDADRIGRRMADLIGVPPEYEMVAWLPVGVPLDEPKRARKQPFAERAWFDRFGG